MKNYKSFILIGIISAVLILVWYFRIYSMRVEHVSDNFVQERAAISRLLHQSSEIHRVWEEGEGAKEWKLVKEQCLNENSISTEFDESLLRCNPMLILCVNKFLSKKIFNLSSIGNKNNQLYNYLSKSNYSDTNLEGEGYLFKLLDEESKRYLFVKLADHCKEIFLEEKSYAYGEKPTLKKSDQFEFRFDNFGKKILIDRYLVTNQEVNDWIDFGNQDTVKGLSKKKGNDLFLPATDLKKDQMEHYCAFKGKQNLMAHYFDAATFLYGDEDNLGIIDRSPYYFSRKKSDFKRDCKLIYAKECLTEASFRLNYIGPTWAGLTDSMGGVFEYLKNPIEPEKNLKLSSFYFNFNSPVHKLGARGFWDGDGFNEQNFTIEGENLLAEKEKIKVGFRCMREVFP